MTYIDALGRKSLVLPVRRRLNLERAPGAVMEIAAKRPGSIDISADVVACEGLENGLSIACVKHPAWRIIAAPGIAALQNVALSAVERRIIVFQDSDPEGHSARKGLTAGVDALIAAGKSVRITELSEYGDANNILQAEELGEKELQRLLAKPAGATLSFEGKVDALSKLPETEYMKARREVAKDHKIPVSFLDKEVTKRRPKPAVADDSSTAGLLSVPEDPAWTGPVPDVLPILEALRKHFRRFVSITEMQLTAVVLWIAAAHLLHSPKLDIDLFPKLAIESKYPASRKTTLLTLIWNCLPRAKLWTFPTGAYLVRALEQARFSLCLDELQYAEDKNLLRVINASQHLAMAYVPLLVPDHKGAYVLQEFFVWAPMALARLGKPCKSHRPAIVI